MVEPSDHEVGFFRSFVGRRRRGRYLALLEAGKRQDLLDRLCHHLEGVLDPRFAERVTGEELEAELVQRGAGSTCHVISNCCELDGQEVPLTEGINAVFGFCYGSILSCVAGRLAYYEGEDRGARFICVRSQSEASR
ncbi:MAG: hypothetical protein ACYS99_20010 [Planctomycetota bacterium]|jgi:hypothetical protein